VSLENVAKTSFLTKMCKPISHLVLLLLDCFFTMARTAIGDKPTANKSKPHAHTVNTRNSALQRAEGRTVSLRSRAPISSIKVSPTKPSKSAPTTTKVASLKNAPRKSPPVPVTPSATDASVTRSPSPETHRFARATTRSDVGRSLGSHATPTKYPTVASSSASSATNHRGTDDMVSPVRDHQAFHPAASVSNFVSASTLRSSVPDRGSSTNNAPDLSSFGIEGAVTPNVTSGIDKNATLKCCVIRGPNRFALVFRFSPNHPMFVGAYWGEKIMFDAVRERRQWVTSLNISDRVLKWYNRDIPQQNSKGFFVRLFVIYALRDVPSDDSLIRLGEVICQHVNNTLGNNTITTVDPESYFWGGRLAVWADVVGSAEAQLLLYRETNTMEPMPGYYNDHRDLILSFFREGRMPANVATALHAPPEAMTAHSVARLPVHDNESVDVSYNNNEEGDHSNYNNNNNRNNNNDDDDSRQVLPENNNGNYFYTGYTSDEASNADE